MIAVVFGMACSRDVGEADCELRGAPFCKGNTAQFVNSDHIIKLNSAGEFVLENVELVPNGVNSYFLLQYLGFEKETEVAEVMRMAKALGRPVIRTNGFFEGRIESTNPAVLRDSAGLIREEGFRKLDQLLDMAQHEGVRLVLVLSNHWDDFGGARAILDALLRVSPAPFRHDGRVSDVDSAGAMAVGR